MKYIFSASKNPSIDAKSVLKKMIIDELGTDYEILYAPSGKPYIEGNQLFVSISHSKDFFLVGTNKLPVGVDIEVVRHFDNRLINRYFTSSEIAYIDSDEKFFKIWTVKEAFLKLTGEGLKGIKKLNTVTNGKIQIDGYEILSFVESGCAIAIVYKLFN
ncbi:MAG: 4'-phosphopantetheinyl transferase superfamily protein [Clostridiales bacterium]|nr:4'-phosphopantetheinyl transferase superfamily protein [Clostridiales bacterium]